MKKAFRANGRTIPAGTILIGTLEPGSNVGNPRFGDLSSIRAYSPQTGALMQIFKPGDRNSRDCSGGGECMSVDQFSVPRGRGNPNLVGSEIRTMFSTDDLFPGVDAHTANTRFLSIQRDMETNSVLGIYDANKSWQEKIRDGDLNSQLQTLKTQAFNFNNDNIPDLTQDQIDMFDAYVGMFDRSNFAGQVEFAAAFGINYIESGNNVQDTIQRNIIKSFNEFIDDKNEVFRIRRQIFQGLEVTGLKKARNTMLGSRQIQRKDSSVSLDTIANSNSNSNQNNNQSNNSNNNSSSNNSNANNSAPVRPACMNKKRKNRKNPKKCKRKIAAYLAAGGVR